LGAWHQRARPPQRSHCTRRSASAGLSPALAVGSLGGCRPGRCADSPAPRRPAPARSPTGIQDRLGERPRVDLLDRDVQAGLGAGDELDDHLLQIISRTKLRRPDIGLDLAVGKARHEPDTTSSDPAMAAPADPSLRTGRTWTRDPPTGPAPQPAGWINLGSGVSLLALMVILAVIPRPQLNRTRPHSPASPPNLSWLDPTGP
jgi:hypothetical protein